MLTSSRVSVLVSRSSGDPLFSLAFDLGGYEGVVYFEALSETRALVEDSIDFSVSRSFRCRLADAVVALIEEGADHVLLEVFSSPVAGVYADLLARLGGADLSSSVLFESEI
jgi:hypothetical protein